MFARYLHTIAWYFYLICSHNQEIFLNRVVQIRNLKYKCQENIDPRQQMNRRVRETDIFRRKVDPLS